MNTFMGINVLESTLVQPVPALQISPKFEWCTPEFRREYNAWLLERFGTREVAYIFDASSFLGRGGEVMLMNPKHAAMLKNFTL